MSARSPSRHIKQTDKPSSVTCDLVVDTALKPEELLAVQGARAADEAVTPQILALSFFTFLGQ